MTYEEWHEFSGFLGTVLWTSEFRGWGGNNPLLYSNLKKCGEKCGLIVFPEENKEGWTTKEWLAMYYSIQEAFDQIPITHKEDCEICETRAAYWDDHHWWSCVLCGRAGGNYGLGSVDGQRKNGTIKVKLVNVCRHCKKLPVSKEIVSLLNSKKYKGPFSKYIKENWNNNYPPLVI